MYILFDDNLSGLRNKTGVGQHIYSVYKYMNEFCQCDITNYNFFKLIPRYLRKYTYEAVTNFHAFYSKYDLIHYHNQNIPYIRRKGKIIVVTIHDMAVFRFPEVVPTVYVKHNQNLYKYSVKHANAVVTVSDFTKREVLDIIPGADENKIHVIETGLREFFFEKKTDTDILTKNNIEPNNYYFFLGYLTRRKNLEFLVNVFKQANEKGLLNKNTQLVLVGDNWWGTNELNKIIASQTNIVRLGYTSDDDIVTLYKFAKAFVYPSLYEGFGIPIVEAMSQKTPLIISDIPTSSNLNRRHNNQMFPFQLNNEKSLLDIFDHFEKDSDKIKSSINYGDVSQYHFRKIAGRHVDLYKKLL